MTLDKLLGNRGLTVRIGVLFIVSVFLFVAGVLFERSRTETIESVDQPSERVLIPFSEPEAKTVPQDQDFHLENILTQPTAFAALRLTYSNLAQLSVSELQTFVLDVADLSSEFIFLRHELMLAGLRRLASLNPQATVEFVEANRNIPDEVYLGIVVNNWGHSDPDGLLQYVKQMSKGSRRTKFAEHLVGNQLMINAGLEFELDYLIPAKADEIRHRKRVQLATASEALEIALDLATDSDKREAAMAAARWAQQDAQAAFNRVVQIQDFSLRSRLLQEVFPHMIKTDLNQAIAFLEDESNNSLMPGLVSHVVDVDPELALRIARTSKNQFALPNVLARLAQTEPARAIRYIDELQLDTTRSNDLYSIVYGDYFSADSEAALASVLSRVERDPMLAVFASQFKFDDENEYVVVRALESATHPLVQASLLSALTGNWLKTDTQTALDQIGAYQSYSGYGGALAEVARKLSESSPERALNLIEPYIEDEMVSYQLGSMLQNWHQQNPESAEAWLANLAPGPAKDQALNGMIQRYVTGDLNRAIDLISQMTASYQRDDVTVSVATHLILRRGDISEDDLIEMLGVSGNVEQRIRGMKQQMDKNRRKYRF